MARSVISAHKPRSRGAQAVDHLRQPQRHLQLQAALIDRMPEQLLGLLDPVHDRVLMDPETTCGPRRAEVLLEVDPDRRPAVARRRADAPSIQA
jgi:hypothetical protein